MVDWISLAFPLAYLGILSGSLAIFSSLYRSRKAAKSASLAPWFPPHLQRNIYLSLLHLEQTDPAREKPITVPDSILKTALLRRATEDIRRIISIRSAKQALSTLLARGSVGDDLWQRFLRAEKEMEEELKDVVTEANALAPNWGQTIFQSANEMANNALIRQRYEEIQAQAKVDREWWDQKRATTQAEFMKELDTVSDTNAGSKATAANAAGVTAVHGKASTPSSETIPATPRTLGVVSRATTPRSRPTTAAGERGSDEDAVFVDGGGPTTAGGTKSGKKKKGKK